MDSLPAEILLEIGKTDLETYVGMLAIPRFARKVTVGYRLDMMIAARYEYNNILNSLCTHESIIKRCSGSQIFTRCVNMSITWLQPPIIRPYIFIQDVYHDAVVFYNLFSIVSFFNGRRCSDNGVRTYININPVTKIHIVDCFGTCLCS